MTDSMIKPSLLPRLTAVVLSGLLASLALPASVSGNAYIAGYASGDLAGGGTGQGFNDAFLSRYDMGEPTKEASTPSLPTVCPR